LADAAKQDVWAVDHEAVFETVTTMEALVQRSIGGRGTNKLLFVVAVLGGVLGVTLAAGGIYGVMAHAVSQRTQEFGVRVALGARSGDILRLVVGQGMKIVIGGAALGLTGAWAVTRVLEKLLFGIKPTDLPTYGVVLTLLILVALAACWIPARRATRVDPMVALRYE
jgi:putative ABC transport system permease protein